MKDYRIEENGDKVTVWDDGAGVGLRFTKGDTLQRYTSELVISGDWTITKDGLDALNAVSDALTEYAAELYPMEFEPIKP
jgi:hypothetical protein